MIGVNFQPGESSGDRQPQKSQSLQEAIKILSLRLPKTVGARSIAPGALLNAQGSGGNPRVDSVVNQVLARMFPTGQAAPGGAPMIGQQPTSGPMPVSPPVRYDGSVQQNTQNIAPTTRLQDLPSAPSQSSAPRITFNNPTPPGTMMPDEWKMPLPGPPPGFDGTFPHAPAPMTLEEVFGMYQPAPPPETYAI